MKQLHMERMIEVNIDIFDSTEYERWVKSREELDDDTLSDVDKMIKESLKESSSNSTDKPTPTVAKFRFTPSSLVGVFETFSMAQADKETKDRKLDNIMLVFATGMEQRANLSLKQWDKLLEKYNKEEC